MRLTTVLCCALALSDVCAFIRVPTRAPRLLRLAAAAAESEILFAGETLWDGLPEALFLGGAPLNGACHVAALGGAAAFASCVGDDELGREAVRRLVKRGVDVSLVQQVERASGLETGFVKVDVDASTGDASYEFVTPSAWDALAPSDLLRDRAAAAAAVVTGSLGRRDARAAAAIGEAASAAARHVFDVNLRPPYDVAALVLPHCEGAWLVKMNEDELPRVAAWLGVEEGLELEGLARAVAAAAGCSHVCVTEGADGASLLFENAWYSHPGVAAGGGPGAPPSDTGADTVGAGDSFLAALLVALLSDGAPPPAALARACTVGAYVAGRRGATPPLGPLEVVLAVIE